MRRGEIRWFTCKAPAYRLRRVMRLIERTTPDGQRLLLPERELEGWWTSLTLPEQAVIEIYADPGTHEHLHEPSSRPTLTLSGCPRARSTPTTWFTPL